MNAMPRRGLGALIDKFGGGGSGRVGGAPAPAAPASRGAGDAAGQLRLLLDHMPDGVLAFDPYGRIEWINPAARQMFQVGAADVVGHPVSEWITPLPEAVNPASGLPDSLLPAQAPRRVVSGRRRDGSSFPLEVARVDLPGAMLRAGMCVCRDVSETQRIERMQREFVSIVSHELRTPLTSLRGSLALLNDGTVGGFEPDATKLLRLAHDNAERLVHLVNDILDFEKLRAGALKVEPADEDLGELARQALEAIEGMAAQVQVRCRLVTDGQEHPVRVDAARTMQVLANLLSNAIKHSPPGSGVRVAVERRSEHVRLSVTDSGPGVPEAFVSRLFEPFSQALDPRARKQGGTGLGLAISRGLMGMMHGAIGLSPPRPGVGATFWIQLPLNHSRPSTFGSLDELM